MAGGRSVLLSSTLVTGLVLGFKQFRLMESLELFSYDQMARLQQDAGPDPRFLVVGITESDLQAQAEWPLSDQTLAQLLTQLQQYQPKVIGLDLYRNVPRPPGHTALQSQLQANNLIVITKFGSSSDVGEVPPPPDVPPERVGFNDFLLDQDNVLRRNLMLVATPAVDGPTVEPNPEYYSFALRLSLAYLADRDLSFHYDRQALRIGQTVFPRLDAQSGGYQRNDADGYQTLVKYRDRHQVARQVSLTQVLKGEIEPDWVQGKVVLIGTTASSLKDLFYTPLSSQSDEVLMPGVVVHAQMASQILAAVLDQQPLYWFWPQWAELLWIWGWSAIAGLLIWQLRHPVALGLVAGLGVGSIFGLGFILFSHMAWVPVVAPSLAFILTSGLAMAQQQLYSTGHDSLTGLPNRTLFLRRLRQALKQKPTQTPFAPRAVFFLDLDRFKLVNESLGHHMGDRVLLMTVERLRSILPRSAELARMGGDEFTVLMKPTPQDRLAQLADQMQAQLTIPFQLDQTEVAITVSIGIALTKAGHNHKPEDLLRDAHTAMYRAKALGKARHEVFATGMLVEAVNRLQLESDLRHGLDHQEFCLYYQPIISLATGHIAGFEALVRWQHQKRGFVLPSLFIPVAEETGLIVPLGQWVFREACHQIQQWRQEFPLYPSLMMNVNLSSRQFNQPNLVEQLEQSLKETGVMGSAIKVEITESMVMGDVESAIDLMLRLKSLELKLGIDDFGTGYSSLSYLHRFPMDTLKVDQSFVSRMEKSSEDYEIVRTIVSLGHNLGMDIVAEGVETAEQMKLLQQLNCEYGQGYFFAKPLPSDAAATLLAQQPRWL